MPDSDGQGKEMQGWAIRSRQVPMEANQLPTEPLFPSSAVDGGDKADPRAAFGLVLFLDANMLFIKKTLGCLLVWEVTTKQQETDLSSFRGNPVVFASIPQPEATRV